MEERLAEAGVFLMEYFHGTDMLSEGFVGFLQQRGSDMPCDGPGNCAEDTGWC